MKDNLGGSGYLPSECRDHGSHVAVCVAGLRRRGFLLPVSRLALWSSFGTESRVRRLGRRIALVDRDVEAGLLELLFNIDLACRLQGREPVTHPANFLPAHPFLGNVDGGSGEVRANDIAFGRRRISIHGHQVLLVGYGAHGRADFKRTVKLSFVRSRQIGEKACRPGATVAMVFRQVRIHSERRRGRHGDKEFAGNAVSQVVLVLDALQALGFRFFVLALERGERPADFTTALVAAGGEISVSVCSCMTGGPGSWGGFRDRSSRCDCTCGSGRIACAFRSAWRR